MPITLHPILCNAIFLVALYSHIDWAMAQNDPQKGTQPVCAPASSLRAPQLYGVWQATFTRPPAGLPARALVLLEKHEEFSDSLAGIVSREGGLPDTSATLAGHAARAALAGDIEDGLLVLDESSNNISISGTWNGQVTEGSCGRQIKGVWRDTSASAPPDSPDVAFTLTRRSGW